MFYPMSNYYQKLTQCDYCKDLDCEIAMTKTELGNLCPNCSRIYESREKSNKENMVTMAKELETY